MIVVVELQYLVLVLKSFLSTLQTLNEANSVDKSKAEVMPTTIEEEKSTNNPTDTYNPQSALRRGRPVNKSTEQ